MIGAGVSGLAAAREITRSGLSCVVLERARGVGGRCASKTLHGERVDYGVPYLHGTGSHFLGFLESVLNGAEDAEVLPGWPHRVRQPHMSCQPAAFRGDQRRLAVTTGVSAFPKEMARGLDVRLGVAVHFVTAADGGVEVVATDGRRFSAPRVILALALPQTLRLLEPVAIRLEGGRELAETMAAVACLPCLTVVAGYDLRVPAPPWDMDYPLDTTILHGISHDSGKRRSPSQRVLVYQARPHYSSRYLDAPEKQWASDILWEAGEYFGAWAEKPAWFHPHRWAWARLPADAPGLGEPIWRPLDGGGAIGFCGEAFSPARGVEGAFLSGIGLARRITEPPEGQVPSKSIV